MDERSPGQSTGPESELWPLLLLQASALEEANRWPEAKRGAPAGTWRSRPSNRFCSTSSAMRARAGRRCGFRRSDDPQGERVVARRCLDHRLARLGPVQARQGRRRDRHACSRRRKRTPTRPKSRSISATRCSRPAVATRRIRLGRGAGHGARTRSRRGLRPSSLRDLRSATPRLDRQREIAPAKLNLALHVRGKLPDGRHCDRNGLCLLHRRRSAERRAGG